MTTILGLANEAGPVGLAFMLVVLGQLSRHLGEVVKMPPYYRLFYFAAGLVGWAVAVQIILVALNADPSSQIAGMETLQLFAHHLPISAGMLLGVATAWRYWGWLLRER